MDTHLHDFYNHFRTNRMENHPPKVRAGKKSLILKYESLDLTVFRKLELYIRLVFQQGTDKLCTTCDLNL